MVTSVQKPVECEAKNTYFIGHLEPNIVGITVVATPMEGNHITRNNMHTLQLWFHAMDFFSPLVIFRLGMTRLFVKKQGMAYKQSLGS